MAEPIRILIIDDNEEDRKILKRLFKTSATPIEFFETAGGDVDLNLLANQNFDCAFIDYLLPKKDGIQILQEARIAGITTPIIMLTGQGGELLVARILKSGANDYIPKSQLTAELVLKSVSYVMQVHAVKAARQLAEIDLRRNEELLRNITNNMFDWLIMINTDGIIEYVNQSCLQALGYQSIDLLGISASDLIHPDDLGFIIAASVAIFNTSSECKKLELRYRHNQGHYLWLEAVATPLLDNQGWVTGAIVNCRNITPRKQLEAENSLQQQRTLLLERLASLGTIVAGVAHEINQPLQALKITVDSIIYWYKRGKQPAISKIMENYQRVSTQVDRIDNIIKSMRSFVQRGQLKELEYVDLNIAIVRALDLIGTQLKSHHIAVTTHLADDLPLIRGHLNRLDEVVINIVINAMHAMEVLEQEKKEVIILTYKKGQQIVLEISNTGPDIPPEQLEKVFEPFFTTKPAGVGMGLGLSIVQSIVLSYNGKITAFNRAGPVFHIEFPLIDKISIPE